MRDGKSEFTFEKFRFFLQLPETAGRMGDVKRALPLGLNVDVIVPCNARNELHGLDLRGDETAGFVHAVTRDQLRIGKAQGRQRAKAAVAARRTPAEGTGLE